MDNTFTSLNEIKIPPLPLVVLKVVTFDPTTPEASSTALEKIINPDKGLVAEIMKVANSAFFGRSGKVKTLKDAITLLGLKSTKNIVIMQSNKAIRANLKSTIFKLHLEQLSILQALVGFDLSAPLNLKSKKEEIFLSSLMQKIGMTILALNFTDVYGSVLEESEKSEKALIELEQLKFKINHVDCSSQAFKVWKLPESYTEFSQNQYFGMDNLSSVSDVDRVSRLSFLLARRLLQLKLSEEEAALINEIFNFYKVDENTREIFNEDYFEMLQDHPFYQMISSQ